jgi:hypothetical protein
MLEKPAPSAEQTATQWVDAFGRALTGGDEAALAKLFLPDSHWRNLFGISWQLATFSGNENLCHELSRRASEVRAGEFRLDTAALARIYTATSRCRSTPSKRESLRNSR